MAGKDPRMKELNEYSSQLIRDLIIPKLTKEVNRAKRYAGLRQVFYSLVLSRWFKDKFNQPQSGNELTKLIDSGNLSKLSSKEAWDKTAYFKAYQKSFKEGEYNLSEPVYTPTGQVIRRYMSGGTLFGNQIRIEQYSNMVDSLIAPKGAYVITGNGLTDQTAISASSALESLKDKAMGRLSQYLNEKEFYQAFLNMKEADTIVSLKEVFDNIVKSLKDKVEDVRTLADFSNTLSVLITIEEAKVILGKKEQYIKNAYETYASLNKENQLKNLADIVHELTDTALETKRLASEIEKKWAKTAGSPLKELKDKIIRMLVKIPADR